MASLLRLRDSLRKIYADYDVYIRPLVKFLFALVSILSVNAYLGYLPALNRVPVVLLGALFCAVTPPGTVAFVTIIFVIGHLTKVSIVAAALMFLLAVLIGGLYLGFRPKASWLIAFIPLCFLWNVPFLAPVVLGLAVGMAAVVPSICAIPIWFLASFVHEHAAEFQISTDLGALTAEFKLIAQGVLENPYLYLMILTFVVCILAVSVIKQLSVDHAWTAAVIVGIVLEAVLGVGGGLLVGGGNLLIDLLGIVLSLGIALLYEFVFFAVDYRATEKLQFEDDDYYYYVKAVPKIRPYEEDERGE